MNLFQVCLTGEIELVFQYVKRNSIWDWNYGLQGACQGGNVSIVEFIIKKGASQWNFGLQGACCGGHMHLVELMIKKGAKHLNNGLYYASIGGHVPIIHFLIQKGADSFCDAPLSTDVILTLLSDGLTRKQLSTVHDIHTIFRDLDLLNQTIHAEIFAILPKDLVLLCTQYVCV